MANLHDIKITANKNGTARVEIDGKDVSNSLIGYTISQSAGTPPFVDLHYRVCGTVAVTGAAHIASTETFAPILEAAT